MEKILVSACLLGQKVRYHGGDALCDHPVITKWQHERRIIAICPEVSAGLPIPRTACEIIGGDGQDVLASKSQVISHSGINRTYDFISGANNALMLVQKHRIKIAILKANSPSCGNKMIYDGTYTGQKINGQGVTAALLCKHKIKVFNESELNDAIEYLHLIEQ